MSMQFHNITIIYIIYQCNSCYVKKFPLCFIMPMELTICCVTSMLFLLHYVIPIYIMSMLLCYIIAICYITLCQHNYIILCYVNTIYITCLQFLLCQHNLRYFNIICGTSCHGCTKYVLPMYTYLYIYLEILQKRGQQLKQIAISISYAACCIQLHKKFIVVSPFYILNMPNKKAIWCPCKFLLSYGR